MLCLVCFIILNFVLRYRCAFFHGQVEHPGRRFFSPRADDPVHVAINMHGVYIIDEDDFVSIYRICSARVCQ
jgi:hypothetical protein